MKVGVSLPEDLIAFADSEASRLHLEGLPGNLRLEKRATGLPRPSVANLYDIQKVLSADSVERLGRLSQEQRQALDDGLRLVLDL